MSDFYLRLVSEELLTTKLQPIPLIKIDEFLDVITSALLNIHMQDERTRKLFYEMLKKIVDDITLLNRVRLAKYLLGAEKPATDTFDSSLFEIIDRILEASKSIISPLVVRYHGRLFVKFVKDCTINGFNYRAGDLAGLSTDEFIRSMLDGCATPLTYTFPKFLHASDSTQS